MTPGALVMDQLSIDVGSYYACETDESAITLSSKRHFGIRHIGDIKSLTECDVSKHFSLILKLK